MHSGGLERNSISTGLLDVPPKPLKCMGAALSDRRIQAKTDPLGSTNRTSQKQKTDFSEVFRTPPRKLLRSFDTRKMRNIRQFWRPKTSEKCPQTEKTSEKFSDAKNARHSSILTPRKTSQKSEKNFSEVPEKLLRGTGNWP